MVKFISYTGKYPCLCMGVLTLEIDGIKYTFGHANSFWSSGGKVWFDKGWDEHVEKGAWIINADELPAKIRQYADEIGRVFNDNVPHGCCGGCV